MRYVLILFFCISIAFSASAQTSTKPTRQDSLDLYNNTLEIIQYYKDNYYTFEGITMKIAGEYIGVFTCGITYEKNSGVFDSLDSSVKNFFNVQKRVTLHPTPNGKASINSAIPADQYFKKVDDNKFYTRESMYWILDTRAPMHLFDRRIKPTALCKIESTGDVIFIMDPTKKGTYTDWINDPFNTDLVSFYMYDTLAVKPEDMLTPAERALRNKRYGITSSHTEIAQRDTLGRRTQPSTFEIRYPLHHDPSIGPKKLTGSISGHNQGFEIRVFDAKTGKLLYIK